MKKLTKVMFWIGAALLIASLVNLYQPLGFAAAGLWSFCFVYDKEFRGKF